ncbi:MAG: hypothetical protein P4M09_20700 [Devosia sp.]|nr:hypothetical protein [Devosia sp.]
MNNEVEIILSHGNGETGAGDAAYQNELAAFATTLRAANVKYSQRAIAFDSVDAQGYPLGEFIVAVGAVAHLLRPALTAWIKGRAQRKVTIKFRDVEISASTIEEVDALLARYAEVTSQNKAFSSADEITEAGRNHRFAQWEKLGVERVKEDLLNGGMSVVGGPPQVRELAWEWVRSKEAAAAQKTKRKMEYFVSWRTPDRKTSRFAYPHPDLDSALDFACEGFVLNADDIWIDDANGQKVADRVRVAQYADRNGKPYN